AWFEHMKRYWGMEAQQFAFGVMSRSKQITWENLELRDQAFVREVHRWFARKVRDQGFEIDLENPPLPMFTPFRLRDMVVENRVVVSPMDQYSAVDGVPGDWHFVHLGSRAVGGAGLLYVEMTCPSPEARISPGDTGLWNETQRDAFKRIVDFCHANSRAKLCMQLGHSGRKGSTQLGWERMDHPLEQGNWPVVSASAIPYYEGISQVPREMTRADMDKVVHDFRKSVEFSVQAGCDMVDCSSGQTVPHQKPVYGRMYQAPFSDWVRNEVGIATMTVGAVTTPDQVNTLLASGKADLVALARAHLTNPYFTLQASA